MSIWAWLILTYLMLAFITLAPTFLALFAPVKLNESGASFSQSLFSDEAKQKLENHFSRLQGTLGYWKRETARSGRFHYYCLWWTIMSSTLMPFLTLAIDVRFVASKWFLTTVSAHIAICLGFHRGLKVSDRYKSFRHGESEFYDTYRRLLDRPETFGEDETAQINKYFEEVEVIRRLVRNAETESLPLVENVRERLAVPNTPG